MSRVKGFRAEKQVQDYLIQQGLIWRCSNYQCRLGEIDLIMQDGVYLVFVEVRVRRSNAFGHALETVNMTKQQKIIKTALWYLKANHLHERHPIRFDVVGLQGDPQTLTWIKNAFGG